jgi:hypothetical protein
MGRGVTGFKPWLHHARVYAEWALRRPLATLGAVVLVACGPFTMGLIQKLSQPDLSLDMIVVMALGVGVFGVICRSLAGPDRRGTVGGHLGITHEALPLHPYGRSWAEVAGSLVVWAPCVAAVVLLGDQIPEPEQPTLVGVFGALCDFGRPHLLAGVVLLVPGLVAGRRTTTMGEPGALGPLFIAALATVPVLPAVATSLPLGLVVALAAGFAADRLVPVSERMIHGLRTNGLVSPRIASSAGPWHEGSSRLVQASVRQALPTAVLVGGAVALLGGFFNDGDLASAWFFAGFLLLLAPVITPLALDGRTTSSKGKVGPFTGDFRRAWELLPVEPVTIRRAALRQVAIGAVASLVMASAVLGWFGLGALEVSARAATEFVTGGLATAPLLVAVTLGDDRHRKAATAIGALLFGSLYLGLVGIRMFEGSHGAVSVAVVVGLLCSIWLVRSMLRPCPDEVRGGLPYPAPHGQP